MKILKSCMLESKIDTPVNLLYRTKNVKKKKESVYSTVFLLNNLTTTSSLINVATSNRRERKSNQAIFLETLLYENVLQNTLTTALSQVAYLYLDKVSLVRTCVSCAQPLEN